MYIEFRFKDKNLQSSSNHFYFLLDDERVFTIIIVSFAKI